ncbi:MAG: Ig-like domain-containing protein [Bryobacteraceae bacterium]
MTFSASVTSSDSTVPVGTVTFMDQAETLGTAELDASGDATFGTTNFGASVHFIRAVYGGTATLG